MDPKTIDIQVSCPVFDSFRVQQVAGMFDVPLADRVAERFQVDVPTLDDDWKIGLIVGPSGSGKSTIARRLFDEALYEHRPWPTDRAVVDCLGDRPIKEITRLFTAVGFGSPPSWIKPYQVLSNGERFRCDLARALCEASQTADMQKATSAPLVAFDEFTSVVDRNVARFGSAAIAKAIRAGTVGCRFVAVTCHYDVAEWLQPDWTIDMATSTFQRRCLRRPRLEFEVFRTHRRAWKLFARHHYLSGSLSNGARCFMSLWEGVPTAFCATLSLIGRKNRWRVSRLVTLPDFQGVGIGTALMENVAEIHREEGHRLNATASHPAVIAHWRRSPRWRCIGVKKIGSRKGRNPFPNYRDSRGRAVVSAEFVG